MKNLSDRDLTILKAACDYGKPLLDRTIDTVSFPELEPAFGAYLADELLQEGIGDTIRVSLTEPPVNELPVAKYLANSHSGHDPESLAMLKAATTWGPKLLKREIDEIPATAGLSAYLVDEIMQAARRRFYKPEYIACPGCGRTMYNLQETFEEVQRRTAHLKGMVIAVMGCIVNGPGEMADADWGYVGEGGGKVTIYHRGEPVLRHIPDSEAIDELLRLIEADNA